jgi:hypothetical protein
VWRYVGPKNPKHRKMGNCVAIVISQFLGEVSMICVFLVVFDVLLSFASAEWISREPLQSVSFAASCVDQSFDLLTQLKIWPREGRVILGDVYRDINGTCSARFSERSKNWCHDFEFLKGVGDQPMCDSNQSERDKFFSQDFGDPLQRNLVRVIFLDVKKAGRGLLGDSQWKWLEGQFQNSNARIHLVLSRIQLIQSFSNSEHNFESWETFPEERKKLFDVINRFKVPGVIFLTTNNRLAELSVAHCASSYYPIFDFTSSAIVPHENPKTEESFSDVILSIVDLFIEYIAQTLMPDVFIKKDGYSGSNYGVVTFDWSSNSVVLSIRGMDGVAMEEKIDLGELAISLSYLYGCSRARSMDKVFNLDTLRFIVIALLCTVLYHATVSLEWSFSIVWRFLVELFNTFLRSFNTRHV